MNDEEWQRWAATYAREERPMPPVVARARTDRRRAAVGLTGMYALAALLVSSAVSELRQAETAAAQASPLFVIGFVLVLIGAVHGATWGMLGRAGATPPALLADLERRHAGRRRLMGLMPWFTALAVGGTIAVEVASMYAARRFDLGSALGTLATCAATVAFVWWTTRRVGRLIDRELREAAEARRLLSEGEEGP